VIPRALDSLASAAAARDAGAKGLARHAETTTDVPADPDSVFAHLDEHRRLSAHMTKRNWMTMGSRMFLEVDPAEGRAVGSKIRLWGRVLGLRLDVEEAVIERVVPRRKVWQTIGAPRLLVIGGYRMGFEIVPCQGGSRLRVFIDYDRPRSGIARVLGLLLGAWYAAWCTRRMAQDAAAHFRGERSSRL
jgi:hypothetical protein